MNYLKTAILLGFLAGLFVAIGWSMAGQNGALIGLCIAGVMNFVSYWYSDKIVLKMYRAKEVTEAEDPELVGMVRDLATRANLPMPKVYVMNTETPNAFATGRNPSHAAVAATSGIRKLLTKEELMGVMAHELSHIQNRDILISTIAATIAGAISYISHWAMFFTGGRDRERGGMHPAVMIAIMILAPLAAMLVQMAISRSREYAADKGGADIAGNPMYLAEALRKLTYYNQRIPMQNVNESTAHMFIVSPITAKGLKGLFSTHPPLEERIKRLEAMVGVVS